jgi:hypothetical protein
VLRRIFERKRDDGIGGWRKMQNVELHKLYSSPNIIRIKSRRMRWAGYVARMVKRSTYRILVGKPEKRDHYEDQNVGGWTILKWILEREGGML